MTEPTPTIDQYTPEIKTYAPNSSDYIVNDIRVKAKAKQATNRDMALMSIQEDNSLEALRTTPINKVSFQNEGFRIDEAYTKLNNGNYIARYDNFLQGSDNENRFAQEQSTGSKWLNGVGKFIGKTATNVVGGTLGTAYGLVEAIGTANFEAIYDNDFYDLIDDQNTKMDNFAANYRSQQERDMNFGQSMLTANFWADDFLGGMSFMAGTVISEGIWAAATGGTSLTAGAARAGLKGAVASGIKGATKGAKGFIRKQAVESGIKAGSKAALAGELLNTARFTYTSAGFEAGMEARMFKKEQEENFFANFEQINGRKPTGADIAEFNSNNQSAANMVFATNMALVGTSNLAILGKAFNIKSPFSQTTKSLNKQLFGTGLKTTIGESGERVTVEAIKRTGTQRAIGGTLSILKNPFYEGFVEEGGQAVTSSAGENYIKSTYDLNPATADVLESIYEGLSHTYGTKEGWKEVGLGMLIGLVGGEAVNVATNGVKEGVFTEQRNAFKKSDPNSQEQAEVITESMLATKVVDNFIMANSIANSQEQAQEAENRGDMLGKSVAEKQAMLTSIMHAHRYDSMDDQISDMEAALNMKSDQEVMEAFGVDESQVKATKQEILGKYKEMSDDYVQAKTFADYSLNDDGSLAADSDLNIESIRSMVAMQIAMTNQIEGYTQESLEALKTELQEILPQLSDSFTQALTTFNKLEKTSKELRVKYQVSAKRLTEANKLVDQKIEELKTAQNKSTTVSEGNKKIQNDNINQAQKELEEAREEAQTAQEELKEVSELIGIEKTTMKNTGGARYAGNVGLNSVDPLNSLDDIIAEQDVLDFETVLDKIDQAYQRLKEVDPIKAQRIQKIAQEYKKSISMWKRNAQTVSDLTNPELGLKNAKNMFTRKKSQSQVTKEFLERLQVTNQEADLNNQSIKEAIKNKPTQIEEDEEVKPPTPEVVDEETLSTIEPNEIEVEETPLSLLEQLKDKILGENAYARKVLGSKGKKPTEAELQEYIDLRAKAKPGDINRLVRTPSNTGLTQEEYDRFEDLLDTIVNWRVVSGTSMGDIFLEDVLNQIALLEQGEVAPKNETQTTLEQTIELTESTERQSSKDSTDSEIVNTMDTVVAKMDKETLLISHLDLKSLEDQGLLVELIEQLENGNKVYQVTDSEGLTAKVILRKDGNKLQLERSDAEWFLDRMKMAFLRFKSLSSGWIHSFSQNEDKSYSPMDSDFKIEVEGVQILNPQMLYDMKKGDKIQYEINYKDSYNNQEIYNLVERYLETNDDNLLEEIENMVAVYATNTKGDIIGFLKANYQGYTNTSKNFLKLRQEAGQAIIEAYKNKTQSEIRALQQGNAQIVLPYTTEVKRVYIGTPNIRLDENKQPILNPIPKEQRGLIVGFGYTDGKEGKLNSNSQVSMDQVDKTYIRSGKKGAFVVIQDGKHQIAFPVTLENIPSDLKPQVEQIINSQDRSSRKVVDITRLLMKNGIDPTEYNLLDSQDVMSTKEIGRLLRDLEVDTNTYSEAQLESKELTQDEFLDNATIVIDLTQRPFRNAKMVTELNKDLKSTKKVESKLNRVVREADRDQLKEEHKYEIASAESLEELDSIVANIESEEFRILFYNDKTFREEVERASERFSVIPNVETTGQKMQIIENTVDIDNVEGSMPYNVQDKQVLTDLENDPTNPENIQAAAKSSINQRPQKVVEKTMVQKGLVGISETMTTEEAYAELSVVKVSNGAGIKVSKKSVANLMSTMYQKYQNNSLPLHLRFQEGMSELEFQSEFLKRVRPGVLQELGIYLLYYNSQEIGPKSKSQPQTQVNEDYLKGEFQSQIAKFKNSVSPNEKVHKEVLSKLIFDGGYLSSENLTRKNLDDNREELGEIYQDLLDYSVISKLMDLGTEQEFTTFTEPRLYAINNPETVVKAGRRTNIKEGVFLVKKAKNTFLKIDNEIYEQTDREGEAAIYQRIGVTDNLFVQTQIRRPANITVDSKNIFRDNLPNTTKAKVKNKLSASQLKTINDKNFQCS